MLKIKKLVVGQLQTNCYLVIDDKRGETLIIDPGDDADYINQVLTDLEANPKAIIATHGHFDHILAAMELKLSYKIPFLMSAKDKFLLSKMQASTMFFTGNKVGPPPKIDDNLVGGNKLGIGNCKLKIIGTPGHTPGSLSFYSSKDKTLFCGDLVFVEGGVGRTDFAYSNKKDLVNSIAKIIRLPEDTKVFCGHGDDMTIEEVKLYNIK